MVQLPVRFLGITLTLFMLSAVSGKSLLTGTSTASIASSRNSRDLVSTNSTTVPTPVSVFLLRITITNQIFNESLRNRSSDDKELRDELTQLLDDVYTSEPYNYLGISAMTFSEGPMVANTTIVFNNSEITPSKVKYLFLSYIKKNPQSNLDLSITEEISLPDVEHQENPMAGTTMWTSTSSLQIETETTVNHESTSPLEITNTKTTVSEIPQFTQTLSSMHDTTNFYSENKTTVSAFTGSISDTILTINSSSDATTITSVGTTKSPSIESTQSQLTHDTKDSTTTSYPLRSSTIHPITNFTTSISTSIGPTRNTTNIPSSSTTYSLSETSSSQIYSSSPTVHPTISSAMTTVITSSHNTTIHSTDITSTTSFTITHSLPLASTTDHSVTDTPNATESNTAIFEITFTPNSSYPHPNPGSTAQQSSKRPATTASTSSPLLGKTTHNHVTRTTLEARTSPSSTASPSTPGTTAAAAAINRQAVPGWAIALLVLASLILLFLILLFIVLLVYWCCKRKQYDFMNMSEDPGICDQVNYGADIPMYTTHSHFESSNGKPYEDSEKPMKNRTMYAVNKR